MEENEGKKNKKIKRAVVTITYGCRKCSKSHALRMLTERSGKPRCGLHASCSIMPMWWKARCCLRLWSMARSRGVSPLVMPELVPASFSPSSSHVCRSCAAMASLRHRKCRDMAFWASAVYGVAAPNPITESKKFTTICIWSQ
ncbi:hypothetical protein PR202_gb11074 [Eleusine coracana subsp. coracana]|uniref:Uncharacterized protein n=1 Tax=Eleusine coracana subsp. coracana TaxID=191504 RepID=A0AAV5ELL0_ELECO|nr:hypothetical protein PR202_gb11074 [Eleusine coracana subsp. coracana]